MPTSRARSWFSLGVFRHQPRQVFGYFALGALLGLLLGLAIGLICVWLIIKCCDKAKVAPYYVVSGGTTCDTGGGGAGDDVTDHGT